MRSTQIDKYIVACSQPQSDYAVEHFVDGSKLTPERRFRQSVIELDVATGAYENAKYELTKKRIELSDMLLQLDNPTLVGMDRSLLELEVSNTKRILRRSDMSLAGMLREMDQHNRNLSKVESELGFTKDTTETEIRDTLQKAEADYYLIKLALDAAIKIVSNQSGLPVGVLNAIHQMPEDDLVKFQSTVHGLVQSVSTNSFIPAIHGKGSIEDIQALGMAVMPKISKASE